MGQRLLVDFDKSGAEWHIVAYASGDGRMIDVSQSGKSPHLFTGNYISRVPEDIILAENKLIEHITDPLEIEEVRRKEFPSLYTGDYYLPRNMSIRQAGKKANHGLNYMEGPNMFAEISEMDATDAKRIHHAYSHEIYPGLPLWWESIKRQLRDGRTIYNCMGRKRRFFDPWGNEMLKKAVAHIPQSTSVDVVNGALIQMYHDDDLNKTWDELMQIHDNIVSQVLVQDIKKFATQCIKVGLDYLNPELEYSGRKFRIGTDMKLGFTYGHMKEVKLTRDVDRLAKDIKKTIQSLELQNAA